MNPKILLQTPLHPDSLALLQKAEVVGPILEPRDALVALRDCHALIVAAHWHITGDVMDSAPLLRVVGRPGIGLDNIDLAAATARGVVVVHTPDAPTESTAQHAAALILALSKRLKEADNALRKHGLEIRGDYLGVELRSKTLAVIGLGRIGSRVAEIFRAAFQMRVLGYDPYVDAARAAQLGVELRRNLHDVLREADVVTLHPALTSETRHLIGAAELAVIKPTAILVNVSRGPVVDEAALLAALREKRIAGAGLDVFDPEPPARDNPLFDLDNVIVTPHIGSWTHDGTRAMSVGVAENVMSVLRGERPATGLANPEVWGNRRVVHVRA